MRWWMLSKKDIDTKAIVESQFWPRLIKVNEKGEPTKQAAFECRPDKVKAVLANTKNTKCNIACSKS